jgi:aminopeptidase N
MSPYNENGVSYAFMPLLPVWEQGKNNITMNTRYTRNYNVFGNVGNWKLGMRLSTPWSDYSYGGAEASWTNDKPLGKLNFRSRLYAVITNSMGNMAPESAVQAAGANMEDRYDNKFTRDLGNIPLSDVIFNMSDLGQNLHLGGSLNLRGFNGYAIPVSTTNGVLAGTRGNRGASVNTELDFSRLFGFMPRLSMLQFNLYAFGDAGIMAFPDGGKLINTGLLADAGLGTVISIKNWGNLLSGKRHRIATAAAPLRIRIDFPLVLNAVQQSDDYLKFRWLIGIGKAF